MRQCTVTRARAPQRTLLRLALGPEGQPYVDLLGRAPGRGVYVTCDPEVFRRALSPKGVGRAFRGKARAVPAEAVETMLDETIQRFEARLLEMLGIARRAGLLELGMDAALRTLGDDRGSAMVVLATDLGGASARKVDDAITEAVRRGGAPRVIHVGTKTEIGSRLGRSELGVVAVRPSRHADRMMSEADRWLRLRGEAALSPEIPLTDASQAEQSGERRVRAAGEVS